MSAPYFKVKVDLFTCMISCLQWIHRFDQKGSAALLAIITCVLSIADGFCAALNCQIHLRFTSGATPADLLMANKAAEPFWSNRWKIDPLGLTKISMLIM